MRTQRHAEIAGGGIVGLTAATVLAQHGWSVRVHERNPELREIGAGLTFWPNGVHVLREIDVFSEALRAGEWMRHWRLLDERGRTLQEAEVSACTFLRRPLHRTLADRAQSLGIDIITSSPVAGATAEGELVLRDGSRLKADLVVGADGVHSAVRDSLGLAKRVTDLRDGCLRHLVPRHEGDPSENFVEHWDGSRRIGIIPCAPEYIYIFLCCSAADMAARSTISTWIDSFPQYRDLLGRIGEQAPFNLFLEVRSNGWTSGRVAIVGDAANAMSANLGLAANIGIVNTYSLGQALDVYPDVVTGLQRWEASERPITLSAQKYSRLYTRIVTGWPRALLDARSGLVWALGRSRAVQKRIRIHPACRRVPQIALQDAVGRSMCRKEVT